MEFASALRAKVSGQEGEQEQTAGQAAAGHRLRLTEGRESETRFVAQPQSGAMFIARKTTEDLAAPEERNV